MRPRRRRIWEARQISASFCFQLAHDRSPTASSVRSLTAAAVLVLSLHVCLPVQVTAFLPGSRRLPVLSSPVRQVSSKTARRCRGTIYMAAASGDATSPVDPSSSAAHDGPPAKKQRTDLDTVEQGGDKTPAQPSKYVSACRSDKPWKCQYAQVPYRPDMTAQDYLAEINRQTGLAREGYDVTDLTYENTEVDLTALVDVALASVGASKDDPVKVLTPPVPASQKDFWDRLQRGQVTEEEARETDILVKPKLVDLEDFLPQAAAERTEHSKDTEESTEKGVCEEKGENPSE
ncbi:unnamed protein product [Vitrella brassicaformis CCMP3155]|uniref:Uncharacterized protein n=1 Tax=Vitrella brassicaformis (strain CCMP3155) TaxID=1169540 RepID=A0A0G4GJU8_VITBC|nr:unnamed protein product [Vitrella brassicaformis CCMP3155]|eukprot:CEM30162.1 unnamed protein product [Vitrella brassicaformis CCMP3155]